MKLNHIYITRFVAALFVVIYHYGQDIYPFNQGKLISIFRFGNESVNYFFFLSGFIMIIAYYRPMQDNKQLDKVKYFVNRFARIYPVYLFSLVLVSAYYLAIDKQMFSNFNIRFLIEAGLIQSWMGKTSLNYPGWSLSVEFFFYLCFPFLLQFLSSKKLSYLLLLLVVIYIFNLILRMNILQFMSRYPKAIVAINVFPLVHLPTFMGGMMAGFICVRKQLILKDRQVTVKIIGYVLAILYFLFCIYIFNFSKYHLAGLLIPSYFFFLIAFSLESRSTKILANKFFVYLGDISYSLYILQFPVWIFFRHFTLNYSININVSFYLYLLVLIIVSSLTYTFFERKIQAWIKSYAARV